MTISMEDLQNSILESLDRIQFVKLEDMPNIDLYMDQVTTFMDKQLQSTTRNPGDDKILTKTMINNYAKNNLLPPPVKKKYSKDHMMILTMIYYLKGVLSFNDIQQLLNPITEKYFQAEDGYSLEDIYRELFSFQESQKENIKKDITDKLEKAKASFQDAPKEDAEFFDLLSIITLLGFDVYVKRLLMEKIIDAYRDKQSGEAKEKAKEKTKEKAKEKEERRIEPED